jgi:hypothetical protein
MSRHFEFDKAIFDRHFPHAPFAIRHRLREHELFRLERLVELAGTMDRDRIEYACGALQPDQDTDAVPKLDLTIAETIRQIETCGAWMVIKNVETVPAYDAFIRTCLGELAQLGGPDAEHMDDFQGFVFISSPGSVTPFHVDAEQNFLVQIKGAKSIHIFDNRDRELVSDEAMEISPANHRNRRYAPEFESRAQVFDLTPGDGVYVPHLWPHWVENGPEYSISMAITWKTPSVKFRNHVLAANGLLRRLGLPQAGYGAHPRWDTVKARGYAMARLVVEPLRKSERIRKVLRRVLFGRKANYYYES